MRWNGLGFHWRWVGDVNVEYSEGLLWVDKTVEEGIDVVDVQLK
jgi:hypothetical protein